MKESRYVILANTMLRVIKEMLEYRYISIERVITSSLFGNIYGVLFAIRQYEGKSYRVFVELLVEAYYLRIFLHLSDIYHTHFTTTLQKFTERFRVILFEK